MRCLRAQIRSMHIRHQFGNVRLHIASPLHAACSTTQLHAALFVTGLMSALRNHYSACVSSACPEFTAHIKFYQIINCKQARSSTKMNASRSRSQLCLAFTAVHFSDAIPTNPRCSPSFHLATAHPSSRSVLIIVATYQ